MPTHFTRKCFYTENVLLNSITVLVAVFFIKLIPQRAFFGNNQENVFQRVYSHSRQLRFTSQFNYFKSSLAAFHIFKHLIGDLILILYFLQKLSSIGEDFCGLDVNTPLGGEQAVLTSPVLIFNTRLTAVVATSTGDFTVVFIGTSTGHLKKVSTLY